MQVVREILRKPLWKMFLPLVESFWSSPGEFVRMSAATTPQFFGEKVYPANHNDKTLGAAELKLRNADKKRYFPFKILGFLYKSEGNCTKIRS